MTKLSATAATRKSAVWLWGALVVVACGHTTEPPSRGVANERQPPLAPRVQDPGPGGAPGAATPPTITPPIDASADAAASPEPPPPENPRLPEVSFKKIARCQRDSDCAIEMAYDCCGGCLSTPVSAISAAADRKAKAHDNRMCAVMDVDCSVVRCPKLPPKCRYDAVCRKGWCEVSAADACSG